MEEIKQKLDRSTADIAQACDFLYQGQEQPGYLALVMAIDTISDTLDNISVHENLMSQIDINAINESLGEALKALEEKDFTLVADIMKYEISEVFEKLSASIL
ncbi:hypothetical protein lbkm_3700 [Lachnospiraceae bacterium KM106-2]|nr:hypothetical protein lbkm_3700 [Lachnospiraceae bacterium KM106-2]